jgi:AcrR family transcriptional regulator
MYSMRIGPTNSPPPARSGSSDRARPPDEESSTGYRRSRTRGRLLEAMIETGARLGHADSSVERVIDGRGIARSTFYEHFGDREECFRAALEMLGGRLIEEVDVRVSASPPERAAQAAVEVMVDFAEREQMAATFLFLEGLAGGEQALALRGRALASIAALLEAAWDRVPAEATTPDLPAVELIGGVFRLLAMRLRHGEAGLGGLAGDLGIWIDSYAVPSGSARSRRPRVWERVEPPAPRRLPGLEAPPPLPGGRHRLSAAEVARSQRLRILSAAARCSHERGYTQTRVTDITTAAQVSRNAFYAQFRGKADAATEANERGFEGAIGACAEAFFAASGWPERVWAGGLALLGFFAAHPAEAYLGFVEFHAVGTAAVQHTYDRVGAFALFLEEGYHWRAEAEELPRASSDALGAVMFELAFAELAERRSADGLVAVLPQLAYLILAPFMGPEEAGEFVEGKVTSASED